MRKCMYALLIMSATTANAQGDVSTAKWLQQPVTIDGKATEWNEPLGFYDAGTRLFFAIANDSINLYLCFESRDEMSQAKLMQGGMKVTLTSKGKPKHEASISYPLSKQEPIEVQPESPGGGNGMMPNRSSFRQRFLSTHSFMNAEGFATAKGLLPLTNPIGVVAALNWDTASNLVYEIAIPKKEFFGSDYGNAEAMAATLTLDVVLNAVPTGNDSKHSSRENRPHGDEMPSERRGQFNGGGYDTGNDELKPDMAAGDGADVSLHSKASFKQKFVLGKAG